MSGPALNIGVFAIFVVVILLIVVRTRRRGPPPRPSTQRGGVHRPAEQGRHRGRLPLRRRVPRNQRGRGDVGLRRLPLLDRFLVAWLIALLLVAELFRNTGRFTMADMLSFRLKPGPIRIAAALSTLMVSFFYLLALMNGAGGLVALLLGVTSRAGQAVVFTVVGALMVLYVLVGRMKGTTWVQIIKAVLVLLGAFGMTVWVLIRYGFDFSAILRTAVERGRAGGEALLGPGKQYGATDVSRVDFLSLGITLVLGTAGLPHVLMRFYTVPDAGAARRSVAWAIGLIGVFLLFTLVLGYGAGALVGPEKIAKSHDKANSAIPLLAQTLGGPVLLGFIAAVAFATILAVVAGLTITASTSFAHDLYAGVLRRNNPPDAKTEIRVACWAAVAVGLVAIVGGIVTNGQNVAFPVALAFAVTASANLPAILYSLFWRRFTTRGALWSIYGGLFATVGLILFSPVVSGTPTAIFPAAHFDWFPLANPGLVTVPFSFLVGYLGTVISAAPSDPHVYSELQVRALTGLGNAEERNL